MPTRVEKARAALLRAEHQAAVSARLKPLRLVHRQLVKAKAQANAQDAELIAQAAKAIEARILEIEEATAAETAPCP